MSGSSRYAAVGPLAKYVNDFLEFNAGLSYASGTTRNQLKAMRALSAWMADEDLCAADLCVDVLDDFRQWRIEQGFRRVPSIGEFRSLLRFLRQQGVVMDSPAARQGPIDIWLSRYQEWLLNRRGLARTTIAGYTATARLFLCSLPQEPSGPCLSGLSSQDVNTFLLQARGRLNIASMKTRVNHVRAFLRFLHLEGVTRSGLADAVPPVAGWRDTGLPRGVEPEMVDAMINSCDLSDPTQVRDRAILLLVARLGLRSIEVSRLQLEDIDWRAGQITIRGKGRRRDQLPLPNDSGEALAAYLTEVRGSDPTRQVFLTCRAPQRPIRADLVSDVVRRSCRRVGVSVVGAHRLRHGLATSMLAAGVPLTSISEVLRHRDIATTSLYAKVDIESLSQLAQPWPGALR